MFFFEKKNQIELGMTTATAPAAAAKLQKLNTQKHTLTIVWTNGIEAQEQKKEGHEK